MDVLNTTGGGFSVWGIIAAAIFLWLTLLCVWMFAVAITDGELVSAVVGLLGTCWFAVLLVSAIGTEEPIRHEVTLRTGYVIDAEKYEIVEQRGKIYVIEEREASE